jgi:toxin ParE1/3/4
MAAKITWSERACADLHELVAFIATDSPSRAASFGESLITFVEGVATFPFMGRLVSDHPRDGLRELVFPPYRIAYLLNKDGTTVEIVRVWHSARGILEL